MSCTVSVKTYQRGHTPEWTISRRCTHIPLIQKAQQHRHDTPSQNLLQRSSSDVPQYVAPEREHNSKTAAPFNHVEPRNIFAQSTASQRISSVYTPSTVLFSKNASPLHSLWENVLFGAAAGAVEAGNPSLGGDPVLPVFSFVSLKQTLKIVLNIRNHSICTGTTGEVPPSMAPPLTASGQMRPSTFQSSMP